MLDAVNEMSGLNRAIEDLVKLLKETEDRGGGEIYSSKLIGLMDLLTEMHDMFIETYKTNSIEQRESLMSKRSTYEAMYAGYRKQQLEQMVSGKTDPNKANIIISVREILAGMNVSMEHTLDLYFAGNTANK